MKDYAIFLSSQQKLLENEEILLNVIDANTLEHMDVFGVVSSKKETPDADRLWVRIEDVGDVRKSDKPYFITIRKTAPDFSEEEKDGLFEAGQNIKNLTDFLLSASEQYVKDIIATTDQWVWEMDVDGRYTYVSSSVEKTLGYNPREVVGKRFLDFLAPADIPGTEILFQSWRRDKTGFKSFLHGKRRRDGKNIWSEATGFPVLNREESLRGWRGVEQNVTHRKEIEEKFSQHQKILSLLTALNSQGLRANDLHFLVSNVASSLGVIFEADWSAISLPNFKMKIKTPAESREDFPTYDAANECSNPQRRNSKYFSRMKIPIWGQDKVMGAIEMYKRNPPEFKSMDPALSEALGRSIGLVLERAYYYSALKKREKEVGLLSVRLVRAQEDERNRISKILHDDIGQILSSAGMFLKSAELELHDQPQVCEEYLEKVSSLLKQVMGSVRDLSHELMPSALKTLGLTPALQQLVRHYQKRMTAQIDLLCPETAHRLPGKVELTLYRITEEALANISRHARASHVSIELMQAGRRVMLWIKDDGVGFDPGRTSAGSRGLGLRLMEDRMKAIGGTLKTISHPQKGTHVIAHALAATGDGKDVCAGVHCG